MPDHQDIQTEAVKLTREAEIGRPADLQHVHHELQKDMDKYTASDYGNLLKGIKNQNDADVKANSHLPTLEISDNGSGGVADSVQANYADGTTMTAAGSFPGPGTAGGGSPFENMGQSAQGDQGRGADQVSHENHGSPADHQTPPGHDGQHMAPSPSDYSSPPQQQKAPSPSDYSPPQPAQNGPPSA